jgi:hypothetical protein
MIKNRIPEPDLKCLIDFLRLSIKPDLEFQAVYQAVMSSFSVQTRLFKALSERKQTFVDVRIKRKPEKIILNFSALPESLVFNVFAESEKLKKLDSVQVQSVEPAIDSVQVQSVEPAIDSVQVQSVEPAIDSVQVQSVEPEKIENENKRRGRGKAKILTSRSSVSVLLDDSDISKLNDLSIKKDLNLSQLVRMAVKQFLVSFDNDLST